jgi:20S proteasome alpha/beta subunit
MTCLVALVGSDGIVLASDGRRAREIDSKCKDILIESDDSEKVRPVGRYCGIGFSGALNKVDDVWEEIKKQLSEGDRPPNYVNEAVSDQGVIRRAANAVFKGQVLRGWMGLTMLVAGYQYEGLPEYGIEPVIYELTSDKDDRFAPHSPEHKGYAIAGSRVGRVHIHPHFRRPYELGQRHAAEHLTRVAVYAILQAMRADVSVGGLIRVSIIRKPGKEESVKENCGGYESLKPEEICSHNRAFLTEQKALRELKDRCWVVGEEKQE